MKHDSKNLGAFLQALVLLISKFTVTVDHLALDHFNRCMCSISGVTPVRDQMSSGV
jgi:hypothetical protein